MTDTETGCCDGCGGEIDDVYSLTNPQQMTRSVFCSPECRDNGVTA